MNMIYNQMQKNSYKPNKLTVLKHFFVFLKHFNEKNT